MSSLPPRFATQSWNAKGSVAVNNPATLTKVVGSGSTVVVDHASHRWVTSDLMTFKNATVPAGQARVHADPTVRHPLSLHARGGQSPHCSHTPLPF